MVRATRYPPKIFFFLPTALSLFVFRSGQASYHGRDSGKQFKQQQQPKDNLYVFMGVLDRLIESAIWLF